MMKLNIREFCTEHSINANIIERNCIVLSDSHSIKHMVEYITDDLRFTPSTVWFEYQDWDTVKRRVEGHVCLVDREDISTRVKLWTDKHEMICLYLSHVNPVQFGLN